MKQTQKDALDMFKRSHKLTVDTSAISGTRPAIGNAMGKLKTQVIDPIDLLNQKQNEQIEGMTRQKEANRVTLDNLLYHVAAGTYGYASSLSPADLMLQGQMNYSIGGIENISDESIVAKANDIIGIVNPLNPATNTALNDYGVDAQAILDLTAARDAFGAVESDPEELIAIRKSYTDAIQPLVKLGKKILHDEADKAADTLKLTQKDWWNSYHNARKIISTGHRLTIIEGHMFATVVPTAAKVPLYGGTVEITHENGKVYTANTEPDGHYKAVKIMQGNIAKIKFIHPEFAAHPIEYEAFTVKRGTVTIKDVIMGSRGVANSPA
jgi:hypothetical protein